MESSFENDVSDGYNGNVWVAEKLKNITHSKLIESSNYSDKKESTQITVREQRERKKNKTNLKRKVVIHSNS